MTRRLTHGFRLIFKVGGSIDYAFKSQIARNKAIRQVRKAMRVAGLTAADFYIELMRDRALKGRRLRLVLDWSDV